MGNINKKALFLAVIFSFIATGIIFVYLKSLDKGEVITETTRVYYAAKNLEAMHKIEKADLVVKEVLKELITPNAIVNEADAIGKYLKEGTYEGEQLIKARLVSEQDFYLAYNLAKNERAISINVNEASQVANLIRTGDYVDVVASFDREQIEDMNYPRETKTIIQNVKVLAIGQIQNSEKINKAVLAKTVTLAIDVNDTEKLIYASEYGRLKLVLRSVEEKESVPTNGAQRKDFGEGTRIPNMN
jgi:pilus assembly protein CpaB